MKHLSKLLAILWMAGALVACGGDSTEVPDPEQHPSEQPGEKPGDNPDTEKPDDESGKKPPLDANGNIQFPDPVFAAFMVENFDKDGDCGISPEEAAQITKIDCQKRDIISIHGIQYCTTLTALICSNNNKLPVINLPKIPTLTTVACSNNAKLTVLNTANCPNLTSIECTGNKSLAEYNFSKNTALTELDCYGNQLASLDVSKNTELDHLNCGYHLYPYSYENQLTTLDVSMTKLGNKGVTYPHSYPLSCYMTSLKTLYLKTGWVLNGIHYNRTPSATERWHIYESTKIEYKD